MKTGTFFEINVSHNGEHIFATDSTLRSYTEKHVTELLALFAKIYPKNNKYTISVTCWQCSSSPALPQGIADALAAWESVK